MSIIVGPAAGALTVWVIGEQPTLAVAAALFVAAICIHLTLPSLDMASTVAGRSTTSRVGWSWPVGWRSSRRRRSCRSCGGCRHARVRPEHFTMSLPAVLLMPATASGWPSRLGMAVGYAVAGPLLDQYGARTTTYVTAVAILAIGTMWVGQARRHQGLRADHAADETIDTHIAEVRSHIG